MELELPTDLQLDENTATNLYRIAQEGVLNAARHADAEHIHLRLQVAGPDVELLVIDDGKGFDPLQFVARRHGPAHHAVPRPADRRLSVGGVPARRRHHAALPLSCSMQAGRWHERTAAQRRAPRADRR